MVLAIFIREDSATVLDYANRVGLIYPKVADPDTRIASTYRVYGIPAHFSSTSQASFDQSGPVASVPNRWPPP